VGEIGPVDWSTLRIGYHWADRKIDGGYSPFPSDEFFEREELRMFDQADRERYKLDDFATNSVLPYDNPDDSQGNALDYFIFMDANQSNYRAHLLSVTVAHSF
jgi:hypothetical protein